MTALLTLHIVHACLCGAGPNKYPMHSMIRINRPNNSNALQWRYEGTATDGSFREIFSTTLYHEEPQLKPPPASDGKAAEHCIDWSGKWYSDTYNAYAFLTPIVSDVKNATMSFDGVNMTLDIQKQTGCMVEGRQFWEIPGVVSGNAAVMGKLHFGGVELATLFEIPGDGAFPMDSELRLRKITDDTLHLLYLGRQAPNGTFVEMFEVMLSRSPR